MFLGLEKLKPHDVSSHHDCRLGKWYFSDKAKMRFSTHACYLELDKYHEQVHVNAKNAVEAFNSGNIAEAESCLQAVEVASEKVLYFINDLIQVIVRERQ